jgi:hypothetical protein
MRGRERGRTEKRKVGDGGRKQGTKKMKMHLYEILTKDKNTNTCHGIVTWKEKTN